MISRAVALLLVLAAPVAHAAACCLSASVVGVGRLSVWEDAAGGFSSSLSHGTGRWDAWNQYRPFAATVREDEVRLEAWAMVRLAEQWQVSARVPWVVGVRGAGDASSVGTGVGDVSAAVRWEAISLGAYEHVPGVALSLGLTAPTGRRPEQATAALGASATGRGAWNASLAVAAEYAVAPWFVRLDVGALLNAPFVRADTGATQTFGPGAQVALSGGRELFREKLVVALSLRFEHEFPMWLDGVHTARTDSSSLTSTLSAAWKVTPHWTVTGAFSTDALGHLGVAQNKEERLAFTLGVRHGFF
jgi:hypothetical protein